MSQTREKKPSEQSAAVRWWEPVEPDPGIAALRKRVLGADHPLVGMEFLFWLSGSGNPAGTGGCVVMEREGKVIGIGAVASRLARIDGEDVKVAFAYDLMIDKKQTGANTGRYALRMAHHWIDIVNQRGYAIGVTFPNDNWRPLLLSRHLTWQPVFSPALVVRPLRQAAFLSPAAGGLKRRVIGLGFAVAGAAIDAVLVTKRAVSGKVRAKVRPLNLSDIHDGPAVQRLWEARRDDTRATLSRDVATLRWRYEQHPFRRYEVLGLFQRDALTAILVTTLRQLEGVQSVVIVDAILPPDRIGDGVCLVQTAVRRAAQTGAQIAATEVLPGTTLGRVMRAAGFLTPPKRLAPKGFTLCIMPMQTQSSSPLDSGNWTFAWGDIDVV